MNLLERVLALLNASVTGIAEKAPDPTDALRKLLIDLNNQRVQVKTQVATAMAEHHRLQKRQREFSSEAHKSYLAAEKAIQQGQDAQARKALARHNDATLQGNRLQEQVTEQEKIIARLRSIYTQLEEKIDEVSTSVQVLKARHQANLLQQRLYDSLQQPQDTRFSTTKKHIRAEEEQVEQRIQQYHIQPEQQREAQQHASRQEMIEQQLLALKQRKARIQEEKGR